MAFSTGLVLLVCFHMGDGAFAASAMGMDKLIWLNVHRFSAVIVFATVVTHVVLHWRTFYSRVGNAVRRRTKRLIDIEVLMYLAFFVLVLTAFVAWFVLDGTSPLFGPATIGPLSSTRHPWIETHHSTSLVSLMLVVHHVGHRWRLMVRRARPGGISRP